MSAKKPASTLPLAQILFSQGFGVRRACEGLVAAGRVRLQDQTLTDPAQPLPTPGLVLQVQDDAGHWQAWPYQQTALVLLNKPAGYECSQKPSAWPSVMLLLPAPLRRRGVQSVGRLDQDTTGLLLLTDDGNLIRRLSAPKHHVPKVYEVGTARPVDEAQLQALRAGVVLNDDPAPVRAEAAEATGPESLRLTLVQGKYHQVKRMVAAVGNHCSQLHRSAYGGLTLQDGPTPGQWRWVDAPERERLLGRGAVGPPDTTPGLT